jgi:hypothetical protein
MTASDDGDVVAVRSHRSPLHTRYRRTWAPRGPLSRAIRRLPDGSLRGASGNETMPDLAMWYRTRDDGDVVSEFVSHRGLRWIEQRQECLDGVDNARQIAAHDPRVVRDRQSLVPRWPHVRSSSSLPTRVEDYRSAFAISAIISSSDTSRSSRGGASPSRSSPSRSVPR